MHVGVHNCVSNALEMLEFSSESLVKNAEHPFDYVLISWNSKPAVLDWIAQFAERVKLLHKHVTFHHYKYETNPKVGFVPNLRAMINKGFDRCFDLGCDYAGLVNTDQAFGPYWLQRMVPHLDPKRMVISRMIEAGRMPTKHEAIDFGDTKPGRFNSARWMEWCQQNAKSTTEVIKGGIGMPYLLHKDVWSTYGPWELIVKPGAAPDQKFFYAMRDAGIEWLRVNDALSYHVGAVERTTPDNSDFEKLPYEGYVE